MLLTQSQQKKFVKWYMERYNNEEHVIDKTAQDMIGITDEQDIKDRRDFLQSIMTDPHGTYKIRSWGKESRLDKVFNSLYFNYGPKKNLHS